MDPDKVSQSLNIVRSWNKDAHWFCPRSHADDGDVFFEEDIANDKYADRSPPAVAKRAERIKASNERKKHVLEALLVFAFDGVQAQESQLWMRANLDRQILDCSVCVREYHKARGEIVSSLKAEFLEEDVAQFMQVFDEITFDRLRKGLSMARDTLVELQKTDPQKIGVKGLAKEELSAIFETINCIPALENETFLRQYFDAPFKLVQVNKRLKCPSYLPAHAYFIFRDDHYSIAWAMQSWEKMTRNIIAPEFDFCVREPLNRVMSKIQLTNLYLKDVPKFWAAIKVMVHKMDSNLIKHTLRALPYDVCKLGLDHLQLENKSFLDLLETSKQLLNLIGYDFWDGISPQVWLEQFFQSAALKQQFRQATVSQKDADEVLERSFGWMQVFLRSIRPINQPNICRAILQQLFDVLPQQHHPPAVDQYLHNKAFEVLAESVHIVSQTLTSRAAGAEMAEVVASRMDTLTAAMSAGSAHGQTSSELLGELLVLNCNFLIEDRGLLLNSNPLSDGSCVYWAGLWSKATRALKPDSMLLARALLRATSTLNTIEPFVTRSTVSLSEPASRFNRTLDHISKLTTDILNDISEFRPEKIQDLIANTTTATWLLSHIFSSSPDVRFAMVEILKTVTEKATRAEALADSVRTYPREVLGAFSFALRGISRTVVFSPTPTAITACRDMLDALVNPSDGLLRSSSLSPTDSLAVKDFWAALWTELSTIFSSAEKWSTDGHGKEELTKFCTNVMDFANHAFEQFGVLAGALGEGSDEDSVVHNVGKELIETPRSTMDSMVKWLRLRETHLLEKATNLICLLLKRLKSFKTKVSDTALDYIKKLYTKATNSNLSEKEKAELRSAWEHHTGTSMLPSVPSSREDTPTSSIKSTTSKIDMGQWAAKANLAKAPDFGIKGSARLPQAFKTQATRRETLNKAASEQTKAQESDFMNKRKAAAEEKKRRDAEMIAKSRRMAAGVTGQEGSGVQGMGVYDKEHAVPKGTNVMVSDNEDDDSEDEWDREMFGPKKKVKSTKPKDSITTTAPLPVKPRGPAKLIRKECSSKDLRARIAPDPAELHDQILSWEFFYDSDLPEGGGNYNTVLDTFRDPVAYKDTFLPLLILEAWNGFIKAKEDMPNSKVIEIRVLNRSSVDRFFQISSAVDRSDGQEISEGDIFLASRGSRPSEAPSENHCLVYVANKTFKKGQIEVMFHAHRKWALSQNVKANQTLRIKKVMSIVPLQREYGALRGLAYYDLCEEIIKAKASPLLKYRDETLTPFQKTYDLNKAQAKAIKSAMDNDYFTLIQGPPGSGKTKTITAIVGSLLTSAFRAGGVQPVTVSASGEQYAKKLLVCAPSNAAVDELVVRLKAGVKTVDGKMRQINVVRLGRSDVVSSHVRDVTLDELVNKRLNPAAGNNLREETQKIMRQHQELSGKVILARTELSAAEERGESTEILSKMRQNVAQLRQGKANLSQRIDGAKEAESENKIFSEAERRRVQQEVIVESHVVCATLSASGHEMFSNLNVEFETVVIDEAAQCVELSALIPLKYGCTKCILVGDPQQLPPTVLSRQAARYKYEQSLFVRMQRNSPENIHLLDTQYRMHPEISLFPSQTFYDGRLLDGPNMAQLRQRPWHAAELLGPFRFFDVQGQHQTVVGHSLVNHTEIRVAMQLYERLTEDFPDINLSGKVGVITPYKSQLVQLRNQFRSRFGQSIADKIEFNTTDAFQGREAEIIIFSCVRASPTGGIGFLQDIRRMNVGLTRAKSSLWVLGNAQSLERGEFWAKFLQHARNARRFTEGTTERLLSAKSKMITAPVAWHDEAKGPVQIAASTGEVAREDRERATPDSSKPLPERVTTAKPVAKPDALEASAGEPAIQSRKRKQHPNSESDSDSNDVAMEEAPHLQKLKQQDVSEDVTMADAPPLSKSVEANVAKPPSDPARPRPRGTPAHLLKKVDPFVRKKKPPPRS